MNEIKTDILIAGGGMAGLSSALWCGRLGLKCIILEEKKITGGQLNSIGFEITDYPGIAAKGKDFSQKVFEQVLERGAVIRTGEKITVISPDGSGIRTSEKTNQISSDCSVLTDHASYRSTAVILATGLRRRKLSVPAGTFSQIYTSVSLNPEAFQNRRVLILGGGDGAYEAALNLCQSAESISLVMRSRPRAAGRFLREVSVQKKILVYTDAELKEIIPGSAASGAAENTADAVFSGPSGIFHIQSDVILLKIGFEPASELFSDLCRLDDKGYVITDSFQKTSAGRVWAAGDICSPVFPSLSNAAGQASVAVKNIASTIFNTKMD